MSVYRLKCPGCEKEFTHTVGRDMDLEEKIFDCFGARNGRLISPMNVRGYLALMKETSRDAVWYGLEQAGTKDPARQCYAYVEVIARAYHSQHVRAVVARKTGVWKCEYCGIDGPASLQYSHAMECEKRPRLNAAEWESIQRTIKESLE